jgi:ribosomal protein L37E
MWRKRARSTGARPRCTMTKHDPIKITFAEIVDYWAHREDECGLSVDWAEAHERCWRCGYKSNLERCHIIPHSLGGSDSTDNLVLLCRRCHRESPNVKDPSFIWRWLRAHAVPMYDTYWTIRAFDEFDKLFKREPFADISSEFSDKKIRELLSIHMRDVIHHFGEGRLNPSTIAWILAQVEQRITSLPAQSQVKACLDP